MNVDDPSFPSLWDATLFELGAETGIWETFADPPNFHDGAPAEVQADEAESVLRRIRDAGWARFARRIGHDDSAPLSEEEAETAIRRARFWFLNEREPPRDLPEELVPIFLCPTEKWLQSDHGE